jgi:hypothetical protein
METLVPRNEPRSKLVRLLVVGSWLIFITNRILSFPVSVEAVPHLLLDTLASLFGLIATISALLLTKRWHTFSLIAAALYLATYVCYVTLQSMDRAFGGGVVDFYRSTGQIASYLFNNYGFRMAPFLVVEILMPLSQAAILLWLLRPNPSLQYGPAKSARPLS